jgi:hypothetical protein
LETVEESGTISFAGESEVCRRRGVGNDSAIRECKMSSDIHQISTERERQSDLEFARKAVDYLEKKGLGPEEVIDYLVEEFNLDRDTARALAARAA